MPTAVRPTPDPPGTVATRSAGLVQFRAELGYRGAEEVPDGPTLGAPPSGARLSVVETDDGATREILGEILALSEADLGRALEVVFRSLTIAAALTDAVLETSAARVVPVRTAPAGPLQSLALDVLEAGFPVRFAPTWTPLSEGELGLGVGNGEGNLRAIFGAHLPWSMVGTGAVSRGSTPQFVGEEEL